MKKYILFMMSVWFIQLAIFAQSRIIEVFPEQGKDIENIALALKKAADCKGRPVTVKFSLGIYQLDRAKSHKCYIIYQIRLLSWMILIRLNISDCILIH